VCLTLLDTCYRHGGIGDELDPVQRRFADASVEAWAVRTAEPRGVARRVVDDARRRRPQRAGPDPADLGQVAAAAAGRSWPLHAHVSEQPAENDACQVAYGRTPTGVLADAGALGPRFTAVHAIHLTDADRKLNYNVRVRKVFARLPLAAGLSAQIGRQLLPDGVSGQGPRTR
jgi:hypothetical protein